ncbi:coiled-coil domain-containing protein 97-like [Panonychus citri]|uniref:coiled-coil domain-containing protein 97-like n=1 Tax=Panonychus citri TaxID=50023 RepID=UPI002306FB9A|nr:coiled-coil domain-containing protein 97-like [Panonychus citri]
MDESDLVNDLFKTILENPSAFIVDQQKDAPELLYNQRLEILSQLYEEKKLSFLIRYNQFLSKSQLEFIRDSLSHLDKDDEILYYLEKLIPSKNVNLIKQRRYSALQSLIEEGKYFNDNNMRERNPHLYEQMIGRYLSSKELSSIEDQDREESEIQRPLSTFLLRQMDKNRQEESRLEQRTEDGDDQSNDDDGFFKRIQSYNRKEDGQIQEEEEEEEEEDSDDETKETKQSQREEDEERKELLRKEFTNLMYESFLAGKDDKFDYGTVDSNSKYDPINLINRDAEDSWFDSEEPD